MQSFISWHYKVMFKHFSKLGTWVFLASLVTISYSQAEISLSTGGEALVPQNNEYAITQDLGVTAGNNLFYSFHNFSIQQGETATFSGAGHIANVVSRVTGGEVSNIKGTLKNSIPNANTYLFNPAGILFGEGAKLDVQGGFHASTAEVLEFSDGAKLYADLSQGSRFSSAAPSAFGVLTQGDIRITGGELKAAEISLQGKQIEIANATLDVSDGIGLTLRGENIDLQPQARLLSITQDSATGGAFIHLEAEQRLHIAGHNEDEDAPNSILSRNLGSLRGGDIRWQADTIHVSNATVTSNTQNDGRGGDINLQASGDLLAEQWFVFVGSDSQAENAGRGGDVLLEAQNIKLQQRSIINAGVMGSSDGSHITLNATEDIVITDSSRVYVDTYLGTGNGGIARLTGRNVSVLDSGTIDATAKNIGNGGIIEIRASDTVTVGGDYLGEGLMQGGGRASAIASGSFPLFGREGQRLGNGGKIDIEAQHLVLKDGGALYNQAFSLLGFSGDGGEIKLNIHGDTQISGVNPHGETQVSFASGIYVRSIGDGAGRGGNIDLHTGSLSLTDGGAIKSSTTSNNAGGDIRINVRDKLFIAGDSSQQVLREPLVTQQRFLSRYSPTSYNYSVSGIYAGSEGQQLSAGNSGDIYVSAATAHLDQGGRISTTTTGIGTAGDIHLDIGDLRMDNGASIKSDSLLSTEFSADSPAQRDAQLLLIGDVLEVADVGDGRRGHYVYAGGDVRRVYYLSHVQTLAELDRLHENYQVTSNDVIQVAETGQYYLATFFNESAYEWIAFNPDQPDVTLSSIQATLDANGWFSPQEEPPYPHASVIQVNDPEQGRATYLYTHTADTVNANYTFGNAQLIQHFFLDDAQAFADLQRNAYLLSGATARIQAADGSTAQQFVYQNQQWIALNTPRPVADLTAMSQLTLTRAGYTSKLPDSRHISVGQDWIPSENDYRVSNLTQRDALTAQTGDTVTVTYDGNKPHEKFYYYQGDWQARVRGGDAGNINLRVADNLQLNSGSRISTEAASAGGGSMNIDNGGLLQLSDGSEITSSVLEGSGKGGNLNINTQFLVQDQAAIVARAVEGDGGNIQIASKGFFQFGGASANPIDASSQLGKSGEVALNTPDENLSDSIFVINGQFMQQEIAPFACAPITSLEELSRYRQSAYPNAQKRTAEWYQ